MEDNKQQDYKMKTTKELRSLISVRVDRRMEELSQGKVKKLNATYAEDFKQIEKLEAQVEAIKEHLKKVGEKEGVTFCSYSTMFTAENSSTVELVDRVIVAFQYEGLKLKDIGRAINTAIDEKKNGSMFTPIGEGGE